MVQRCLHPRDRQRRAPVIAPRASAPTSTVTAITITTITSATGQRQPPRRPTLPLRECLAKRTRIIDQDCARRFSLDDLSCYRILHVIAAVSDPQADADLFERDA
jgi:hypothetical protein